MDGVLAGRQARQGQGPASSHYVSKPYRASIKATNKAAAKFVDVPEEELWEDLKAFVITGAKDGDAPARCS